MAELLSNAGKIGRYPVDVTQAAQHTSFTGKGLLNV